MQSLNAVVGPMGYPDASMQSAAVKISVEMDRHRYVVCMAYKGVGCGYTAGVEQHVGNRVDVIE